MKDIFRIMIIPPHSSDQEPFTDEERDSINCLINSALKGNVKTIHCIDWEVD